MEETKQYRVIWLCITIILGSLLIPIEISDIVRAANPPTIDGGTVYWNQDWYVDNGTSLEYWNQTIVLTGNLTINATGGLDFNNVTLVMNCSFDGEYFIDVLGFAWFNVTSGSNITASDTDFEYDWWYREDSSGIITNSTIEECGYAWDSGSTGVRLFRANALIDGCLFQRNYYGMHILFCSPTVSNSSFNNNLNGIKLQVSESIISNNTFTNNAGGIGGGGGGSFKAYDNEFYDIQWGIAASVGSIVARNIVQGHMNYGIFCSGAALLENNTILNTTQYDLAVNYGVHPKTLNTTFNKSKVKIWDSESSYTIQWFLHVNVENSSGDPVDGASVWVLDNDNGTFDEKYITQPDGKVRWIVATEYVQTESSKVSHTPHKVYAYNSTHGGNVDVDINESKEITITLVLDGTPPTTNLSIGNPKYRASPLDDWNVTHSTPITLKANDSISGVNYSWYMIDGDYYTGTSFNLSGYDDGQHDIWWGSVDNVGNNETNTMIIYLDSSPPSISINHPLADIAYKDLIWLNTTINDALDHGNTSTYDYVIDSGNYTDLVQDVDDYWNSSIDTKLLSDGSHTIFVYANDILANSNSKFVNITVDNNPPIADAGPDQQAPQGTNIQLNGSGSLDTGGIVNYTWNFTDDTGPVVLYKVNPTYIFNNIGNFSISLNVTDGAGYSDTDTMWVNVTDGYTPTIALISPSNNSFITNGTIIDLDVNDPNLDIVSYSVNGQPLVELSPPYDIETTEWADGTVTLTVNAVDNASNSISNYYIFHVDSSAPITSLSVTEKNYARYANIEGFECNVLYVTNNSQMSLNASDGSGSGVKVVRYRLWEPHYNLTNISFYQEGGWSNWWAYTGGLTINSLNHYMIIEFYSVDNLNSNESIKNQTYVIDRVEPETGINVLANYPVNSLRQIYFYPEDKETGYIEYNGSGRNNTYRRVWENGTWSSWVDQINLYLTGEDGIRYVEYYSVDFLGHTEDVKNITLYLDNTPPEVTGTHITYNPNIEDGVPVYYTSVYFNFTEDIRGLAISIIFDPPMYAEGGGVISDSNVMWAEAFLLPNATYTCVVDDVTDIAGNPLQAPFSTTFTTPWKDTDNDGVPDDMDADDDNDGVEDWLDDFPLDSTETTDTDGDGIGDNADTDDDGDGVPDTEDAFPLDPTESVDTDGDGIGNNADPDDDNDGIPDEVDDEPLIPNTDTGGEGLGNYWWVAMIIVLGVVVGLVLWFRISRTPEKGKDE